MMRLKRPAVAGALVVLSFLYGGYVYAGYRYLSSQYLTLLLEYSLYPDELPGGWRLLPEPVKMARLALFSKRPGQVTRETAALKVTLYSSGIGFARGHPRARGVVLAEEKRLLQDVTRFLFRSGVGLGMPWTDDSGCTAIHQALIMRDGEGARFLLGLGPVDLDLANPVATVARCRLPINQLAAEMGVELN